MVETESGSVLPHPQSWLMFTPTELLKQYVQEAFNREGVPAPDSRIYTWDDYRLELARNKLPLLKSISGGTLVLNRRAEALRSETVRQQTTWFDDFDTYQKSRFLAQLTRDAKTIARAEDVAYATIGKRLLESLGAAADRSIPATLGVVAGVDENLRQISTDAHPNIRERLRRLLAEQVNKDRSLLDDLFVFAASLGAEAEEEEDPDIDADTDDEEDAIGRGERAAAQDIFLKAVRAQAVSEARKRPVGRASRNGRVLGWLKQRGMILPSLASLGEWIIVQQARRRLARAPRDFVRTVPTGYRAFRRERSAEGVWYTSDALPAGEVTPLEVDIILLAMLCNARTLLTDRALARRISGNLPPILETIRGLYRNQILVDEATDFSPVQLRCMAMISNPNIGSFFACGDFNQRLTVWGSRSRDQFEWVAPNILVEPVTVAYRQSRQLNEMARALASADEGTAIAKLPEHLDNEGVAPALQTGLSGTELVQWISDRVFEIEDFTGKLPSIAVLVNGSEQLDSLASQLDDALGSRNIKAVACPGGKVMGRDNDVRVFEVEYIKGLEFEAVFFVDIDILQIDEPELFEKYLYVGSTRAATYLGMTCRYNSIPDILIRTRSEFVSKWS